MLRFSDSRQMERSSYITETRRRILAMQEAVQPMLVDDKVRTARWEDWKYHLLHAAWRGQRDRRAFYRIRIVSLTSFIIVPSLIGIDLAGMENVAVRWLAFGL